MAEPSSHGSSRSVVRSGTRHDVAVAVVPVGESVARQRLHVDVDGEEVVACLDAVLEHVVEEERSRHPLAHRTALHVGERHHDGVDVTVGDPLGSVVEVEHHPHDCTGEGCRPAPGTDVMSTARADRRAAPSGHSGVT